MTERANLIASLSALNPAELGELVVGLEETLGVKANKGEANGPTLFVAVPAPTVEKSEFDLELAEIGTKKVNVIKVVREITKLGLLEAKALVERAPVVLMEAMSKNDAEMAQEKLRAEGAVVNIK